MNPDTTVALLTAIGEILQAIIWPLVFVLIVLWFRKPLKSFLDNLGEFQVKAGPTGIEASGSIRRQIEAAAALGAAVAKNADQGQAEHPQQQTMQIASAITHAASIASSAIILWVDDRPENNMYERQALERLGIEIDTSVSTEDAVAKLRSHSYDLIISDMGRPPDRQAGYTLLARVRNELNLEVPYIIYAGSNASEHDIEAKRRGATASTGNPTALLRLVTAALAETASSRVS